MPLYKSCKLLILFAPLTKFIIHFNFRTPNYKYVSDLGNINNLAYKYIIDN